MKLLLTYPQKYKNNFFDLSLLDVYFPLSFLFEENWRRDDLGFLKDNSVLSA